MQDNFDKIKTLSFKRRARNLLAELAEDLLATRLTDYVSPKKWYPPAWWLFLP